MISDTAGPVDMAQSFLGTKGYLAPEMLQRQSYSKSVDVWALGIIAFILLCGCLPFDDDSSRISEETARAKFKLRLPDWAQGISSDAKDFLALLLSPDPKVRPTATEALEHRWLSSGSQPDKMKLLNSPGRLRSVPRTPQRTPGNGPPSRPHDEGAHGGKEGGIGSGVRPRGGSF